MKFWSRYSHARYTIKPTYYESTPWGRNTIRGVHAQFEDNEWDSENAQRENKWSDEERKEYEQYLLEHQDYGRTLRSLSEADNIDRLRLADIATCLYMVTIDGEVDTCGRPAVSADGYCKKHAAMQDAPETKPNRAAKADATA